MHGCEALGLNGSYISTLPYEWSDNIDIATLTSLVKRIPLRVTLQHDLCSLFNAELNAIQVSSFTRSMKRLPSIQSWMIDAGSMLQQDQGKLVLRFTDGLVRWSQFIAVWFIGDDASS